MAAGLAPGSVIGGKYRITRQLGQGRASEVWAGEDVSNGQAVAVKLLSGALATNREYVERFKREAQVLAALRNPYIVHVSDHGQTPDGLLFAAMDLLQGDTLQRRLETKGPFDPMEACELLDQILDALGAAHRVGVVHRDIRPENIMLAADARGKATIKVLDFGAAAVEGGKGARQLTVAGDMLGTPQYAAPEQLRSEKTDARTDLYSVGCLAYALLVGEPPFMDSSAVKVMMAQMKDPPPPLRQRRPGLSLPGGLEEWIGIAMAKSPDERFADAAAMRDQLRRVVAGQGLSVPAPKPVVAAAPLAQQQPQRQAPAVAPRQAAPAEARPAAKVVVPEPAAQSGGSWKVIAVAAVAVVMVLVALLALR